MRSLRQQSNSEALRPVSGCTGPPFRVYWIPLGMVFSSSVSSPFVPLMTVLVELPVVFTVSMFV